MTSRGQVLARWIAAALSVAVLGGALLWWVRSRDAAPAEPTALLDPNEWPTWGRTPGEQHYSPLAQIDSNNIERLGLAWHYDLVPENTLTGPIEADGKLFITTGHSYIRAFEAATGKMLWEYDSKTRERSTLHLRLGWGSKGIAYWNGRVFLGTQDGRLISLDANTGAIAWEKRDFPESELRYINGPPRIFDGKLIVGHGGADVQPIRGYVTAYDAMSGKLEWRFYTVPGNPSNGFESPAMKMAAATWNGEWWKVGGGGTAWNAFSYDPELKLVYIGVGNGFPYNQTLRSPGGGDNLFLASVVAVRVGSGEYVWHYQVCPGEQWDCNATQDLTLATLEIRGKPRKVLVTAPKNGFVYVLDRATGEFLSGDPFTKVTWASRIDDKGRPAENPGIRYNGKPGLFELRPGVMGAHSWLPQSYSPRTGLVYIPLIENASFIGDEGVDFQHLPKVGGFGVNLVFDAELPGTHRSFLLAWDARARRERWKVELPGNWPAGTMATAGNLVFQGRIDGRFVAYDAVDGREVWSFETQAPVVAPPVSYQVGHKQYVTVITGSGASGGGLMSTGLAKYRTDYRMPHRVLTFALDGHDVLPDLEVPPLKAPPDPEFVDDAAAQTRGATAFGMNGCLVCHGWNAVGGGSAPDLRSSSYPLDVRAFRNVVHDGALLSRGMPACPEIPDAELEDIRQYLRARMQNLTLEQNRPRAERAERGEGGSFDGSWDITVDSPIGKQAGKGIFRVNQNKISGTQSGAQGSVDVTGTVAGNRAQLSGKSYTPFPVTIQFDLKVSGDTFAGEMKTPFGSFPITAQRQR